MESTIERLRRKLEREGVGAETLTVRGHGYRLVLPPPVEALEALLA